MNVAFCINNSALRGLEVTLSSLIINCSKPASLKLWFLCCGLGNQTKEKLKLFIESRGFSISSTFVDFDAKETFGSYASLHGDWTTYGRVLLPDFISGDQVLYLDADLVVELDVLELDNFRFKKNQFLAAVGGGYFKYALGKNFYQNRVGLSPELEYFNSGVLLIDNKKWRTAKLKDKFFQIANQFPLELPSHDQSVLNILCAGNFARLSPAWNCSWVADEQKPEIAERMIIHFLGAPKPWDPLGFLLHNGYKTWKKYQTNNSLINKRIISLAELKRLWHLRRSYARCLVNHSKSFL